VTVYPGPVIRVLLVDDQELMRMGFRMVLGAQPDIDVVGEAGDGRRAVELAGELRPDVVLMDVRMPVLDGVEATKLITGPGLAKVLVMTTFDLDEYALSALHNGASGFLLKDTQPADLVSALRAVASGDAVVSPSVTRRLLDRFLGASGQLRDAAVLDPLTERERGVLVLIAKGLSNTEIAGTLFLSEATVKTHVGRILAKMDLRDRVQAVVLAYETGLVRPGDA
jgi:DNA-binding NarL/FixJ family response regulator